MSSQRIPLTTSRLRQVSGHPQPPSVNVLPRPEYYPTTAGDSCESCGRSFSDSQHLSFHQRSCKPTKRRISTLLEEAKEFWEMKKRRRLTPGGPQFASPQESRSSKSRDSTRTAPSRRARIRRSDDTGGCDQASSDSMIVDPPAAQRIPLPQRRLPLYFSGSDVLPEPLPTVAGAQSPDEMRIEGGLSKEFEGTLSTPSPPKSVDETNSGASGSTSPPGPTRPNQGALSVVVSSKRNSFRISKTYRIRSGTTITHDPDGAVRLADLTGGTLKPVKVRQGSQYGPFATRSAFELAEWYWGSTQKSFSDFEKLLGVFGNPAFSIPDALRVDWKAAFKALAANRDEISEDDGLWIQDDGWKTTPISIDVPFHKQHRNPGVHKYFAGNFRHRSILSVIKEKIANVDDSRQFHYQPYQATWKPTPSAPEVELYGEMYSSQAFREANEEIQNLPSTTQNEGLERVVVSLMFWSDATRLTSFGGSSLWPCYMFFGNESKYRRCQPSERLGQQIAYFIKLSDAFKDYLGERNGGKLPTETLFSHCARELFQSQWSILLDDELLDAMKNGIVILCPDGRRRCFYPRVFTYSADYPEKILIAGVRNNGGCPCHRCTIKKCDLSNLGLPDDTERRDQLRSEGEQWQKVAEARSIIAAGYAVDTAQVKAVLKPQSLVPTVSSLSNRLSSVNFKLLPALVVDLLHEFEIGVWKNLFIHLIRLLDAFTQRETSTLTAELDHRYRATPAFGRDTIRKFSANSSEMKRKAARDYEDLLQCAIPAFEGLLPEPHNSRLMRLLYICAQWHALAKLRLHHDMTLRFLDYTTVRLGAHMRVFNRDTCEGAMTKELQKEAQARARREGNGNGKATASRKPRKLGVFTIKFHVLGDYSSVIRAYGTTDSYSTETGELCHRLPKSWFERTDKKDYEVQLSQIERRQARLSTIRAGLEAVEGSSPPVPISKATCSDPDIGQSPDSRYSIGATQNSPIDLFEFVPQHKPMDPYLKDTIPKLKQHLLPRILSRLGYPSAEAAEKCQWENVVLQDNRLFSHKIMRINYTTYDVRHEQDVIHVDTPQCNVMLLHSDNPRGAKHPYLYARVIGIFHAKVTYIGQLPDGTTCYTPHRLDFCWAHWYRFHPAIEEFALDRVSPYPFDSLESLDFFDPADALRAAHLIPQFSLQPMSLALPEKPRWGNKQQPLWNTYFVNRFADWDLFMRYQYGMSIGHKYMYDDEHFPSPVRIPTIPPNFDHCTTPSRIVPQARTAVPPPSATSPLVGSSTSPDTSQRVNLSIQGPSFRVIDPAPALSQGLGDQGDDLGERALWEPEDGEDDELHPGCQDEEPNSYDDDMEDEELLAHHEMYGT